MGLNSSNCHNWKACSINNSQFSLNSRAVTKGRGPGAGEFPWLLRVWAPATLKQNQNTGKWKIHQTTKLWIKKKPFSLSMQTLIHLLKRVILQFLWGSAWKRVMLNNVIFLRKRAILRRVSFFRILLLSEFLALRGNSIQITESRSQ